MDIIAQLQETRDRMDKLMRAAQKVNEGIAEIWAALSPAQIDAGPKRDLEVLTDRQRVIFGMIAQGVSVGEIAKRLKLSVRTVEAHRNTIRLRLKFPTVAELNQFATNQPKG